jgi:endonuclease III
MRNPEALPEKSESLAVPALDRPVPGHSACSGWNDRGYFPGIRSICHELDQAYGSPRHGNKSDPLDELVFIILSTRTQDSVFQSTYARLKAAFPDWNDLTPEQYDEISTILAPSGLGRLKASQLVAIMQRLRLAFGRATLIPLDDMSDAEAEAILTSLPGVAAKVAKCVMMYSLDRPVLPVDVHVHRLATRLGFRTKKRPDTSQDWIEAAVPPELRYGFHVNAVAHGRAVCLPRIPRCDACCLAERCAYYRSRRGSE